MNKIYLSLGIFIFVLGIAALFRIAYFQDKKTEQLYYTICREQGCSDAVCQLFSKYTGSVKIECSNGYIISK